MIKEVRLPEISENVDTGDVIKVLVSVGEVIEQDQPIVELETEKAVLEVPSPYKGKVTEVLVKPGDTIKVDQAIIKVDTTASDADVKSEQPKTREDRPATQPESEERVNASRDSEPPRKREEKTPQREQEAQSKSPVAVESPEPETQTGAQEKRVSSASPSVRRMARELGVDLHRVEGTGPGGRVLEEDLKSYARGVVTGAGTATPSPEDVAEKTKWGPVLREPMSKVRRVTARTVQGAWSKIPHVTQFDRVDITELDEIRRQYSKKMESGGVKLTMTAILVKVAASALKVFPKFNASIDPDKKEIIYKRYYHMGVAVDTDRGLLVPVIRAADKKNIAELAAELGEVAQKARDGKLSLEEMEGASFTISNLGGIGGTNFTPIVNPPQVAILGVSRARMEPVYSGSQFEPRLMLPLAVSYDHRIIDGADGARFLRWIVEALEEPILLALEG